MKNSLLKKINTPAYILKKSILVESIESFKSSMEKYFRRNILSYSLKTNSFPYILYLIKEHGGYAEVVSHDEYEMALLTGFSKNNVVYNGPLKSKQTFLEAIINGAYVNIETQRELQWLNELPSEGKFKIGVRVNIDLAEVSPSDSKENEDYSRFGFSHENEELGNVVKFISSLPNVKLSGFHVHRTTLTRSVNYYKNLAKYIGDVVKNHNVQIDYIDIGGGFYGIMDGKPSFDEYFSALQEGLSEKLDTAEITIIAEPGNAIVASAFDFLTTVIDVKKIRDFNIVTTDGSRNDIDPFYRKSNYFFEVLTENGFRNIVPKQLITGGTCLENDKLFELLQSKEIKVGDKILYNSVGAYTMALSPLFIRFFPNVYILTNSEIELLRERWSASDIFDLVNIKESKH